MLTAPRALMAIVAGTALAALSACGGDSGRSYPVDRADDDYDLSAMQLTEEDMPDGGLKFLVGDTYTNEEWANAAANLDQTLDVEQKRIQYEAQGRLMGYRSVFTWENPIEHLGKLQSFESHSTLYKDIESASSAISLRACGLLIPDDKALESFAVDDLADESAGFSHSEDLVFDDGFSLGLSVDTVVCLRTGRIVHAVVQNGLDGTQDAELAEAMARRKLEYIDAAFDGKDPPTAAEG